MKALVFIHGDRSLFAFLICFFYLCGRTGYSSSIISTREFVGVGLDSGVGLSEIEVGC